MVFGWLLSQVSQRGHVSVRVVSEPHPMFVRSGPADLNVTLILTLREALLGFSKTFLHLDNRTLSISRDRPSSPGLVIPIAGEGMPRDGDWFGGKGMLYVRIAVELPPVSWVRQHEATLRGLLAP